MVCKKSTKKWWIIGCIIFLGSFWINVDVIKAQEQTITKQCVDAFSESIQKREPEQVQIVLSATGDVTLGVTQSTPYENSFHQEYKKNGYTFFFDHVRDVFSQDDLTLVNLECSLTTSQNRQEKQWNLKGKPEYVKILTDGSVEAVSMGNNHNRDYGEEGLEETISLMENADIVYAYDNIVGIFASKGISIGIVSVNEHYDGKVVETFIQDGIKELKTKKVNMIVVCCHWGIEATSKLDDYQVELGYKCVDWGADLVIGNHPHVLQGVNVYKGKVILYSLGNFCFGGNRNPKDKDTAIFQQTFTFLDGILQNDIQAQMIPCKISSVSERNNYQPTIQTGNEYTRIIKKIGKYSEEFGVIFDEDGFIKIKENETAKEKDKSERDDEADDEMEIMEEMKNKQNEETKVEEIK